MSRKIPAASSLLAAAAGLTVQGIDLAGLTGSNAVFGSLELLCGSIAGLGLAALWLQPKRSTMENILTGLLLLCHIFAFWLWFFFFTGIFCRDKGNPQPDRQWLKRVLFLLLTIFSGAGGYGVFYWGWSDPLPGIPLWQTLTGLTVSIAIPLLAVRYLLGENWRNACQIACRFPALYAGILFLCSLEKLRYRPPEAWYIYAGLLLICAVSALIGWRRNVPSGISRKILRATWGIVLLLTASYMVLDCWLDRKYFGYHSFQQYNRERFLLLSPPILDACKQYRAKYNTWPEYPEQLDEWLKNKDTGELYIIGCDTDPEGNFRLFLKRRRRIWVAVCNFRKDGSETWEIAAPYHPLMKSGARRWKHSFPHTD